MPDVRQPGIRDVLLVAAVAVAVFHTPLLIAVLVVGTAYVLWRILRAPRT